MPSRRSKRQRGKGLCFSGACGPNGNNERNTYTMTIGRNTGRSYGSSRRNTNRHSTTPYFRPSLLMSPEGRRRGPNRETPSFMRSPPGRNTTRHRRKNKRSRSRRN
jgi:hypothetical protein